MLYLKITQVLRYLKSYGLFRGFKNINFCASFPCSIRTEHLNVTPYQQYQNFIEILL